MSLQAHISFVAELVFEYPWPMNCFNGNSGDFFGWYIQTVLQQIKNMIGPLLQRNPMITLFLNRFTK